MSIPNSIPDDVAHEIGRKWVDGAVLSDLAKQYGYTYARIYFRLMRLGYRVGQGQRGTGNRGIGAILSDEADFRLRDREMARAEALWSALNIRFDDADVRPEAPLRLSRPATIIERGSALA